MYLLSFFNIPRLNPWSNILGFCCFLWVMYSFLEIDMFCIYFFKSMKKYLCRSNLGNLISSTHSHRHRSNLSLKKNSKWAIWAIWGSHVTFWLGVTGTHPTWSYADGFISSQFGDQMTTVDSARSLKTGF